jgi:hypothetical protein
MIRRSSAYGAEALAETIPATPSSTVVQVVPIETDHSKMSNYSTLLTGIADRTQDARLLAIVRELEAAYPLGLREVWDAHRVEIFDVAEEFKSSLTGKALYRKTKEVFPMEPAKKREPLFAKPATFDLSAIDDYQEALSL